MFSYLKDTRKLVTTAVLAGLTFLISLLEIPSPFLPYLSLDFSEIGILFTASSLGSGPLIVVVILRSLFRFLFKGTLIFGEIAAIIASLTLGFTYLMIQNRFRKQKEENINRTAINALLLTSLFHAVLLIALNLVPNNTTWIVATNITLGISLGLLLVLLVLHRKVFASYHAVYVTQAVISITLLTLVMTILNFFFITPSNALAKFALYPEIVNLWFGGDLSAYIYAAILPILPFNILKGVITFLAYYLIRGRIETTCSLPNRAS